MAVYEPITLSQTEVLPKALLILLTLQQPSKEFTMIEAKLLTCQDVMRLTSIRSRTTVWRRVRKGDFPSPIDIGNGRIRWRTSDIAEWIEARPKCRY